MPLDGHSFLVAQGWTGKGSGLREGAISRPLAIPQKRTLAGVGKDRDEAFPFWDHLFSAAAKSIQLKIHDSESEAGSVEDDNPDEENRAPALSRTSTGILSNRRPTNGTPAETSGTTTPLEADSVKPKYSLLVTAKREAAKRHLYSMFFRGPVLGPDIEQEPDASHAAVSQRPDETQNEHTARPGKESEESDKNGTRKKGKCEVSDTGKSQSKRKNRDQKDTAEGNVERKQKRRKRAEPENLHKEEVRRKKDREKGKGSAKEATAREDYDEKQQISFKREKKEKCAPASTSPEGKGLDTPIESHTKTASSIDEHRRKRKRKRKE